MKKESELRKMAVEAFENFLINDASEEDFLLEVNRMLGTDFTEEDVEWEN